jgi:hypothetical protein
LPTNSIKNLVKKLIHTTLFTKFYHYRISLPVDKAVSDNGERPTID